jgi:hypothetical protein
MSTNSQNFKLWYSDILTSLFANGDAGFAILIIALPLLERYLREKSGVHEGKLGPKFYFELRQVFPALKDDVNAEKFWHVYRNGLLHQVTLSRKNRSGDMPLAWLSSEVDAITIRSGGDFWVHPVKFASIIVSTINGDFATFEGENSFNHPFPVVDALSDGTGVVWQNIIPPTGTR